MAADELRILLINPLETRGGEERVVIDLAQGLRDRGHSVGVLCNPDGPLVGELEPCELFAARVSAGWVHYTRAVRRAIRAFGPTLVHAHGAHPGIYGRLGALGCGVPVVWTVHLHPEWNSVKVRESFPFRIGLKFALALLDRATASTVFVSSALSTQFESFAWGRLGAAHVIRNGIDTDGYRPDAAEGKEFRARHGIPERARLVGSVGRLVPRKGGHLLCEALAQVESEGVVCAIAGEGEDRVRIEEFSRRSGVSERFHLFGELSDVRPFLAALDLGVLPSEGEGLPLSVMEMLSSGVPVLLSDIPQHDDFRVAGEAAQSFPLGSAPELARAIDRCLACADPGGRATLARRAAVDHFSHDRMVREYEELYARLARQGGNARSSP